MTTPDPRIAEAEASITSGRFDAVASFTTKYGRDFERASPELRAKLLAIRDGGLERSLPQPRGEVEARPVEAEKTQPCEADGCTCTRLVGRRLCDWHDQGEG